MRIDDILYFSPKYKFTDLKWDNKDLLIDAFHDRVTGFYLSPAEILLKLNPKDYAFAVGVLCVATIDFLARIELGINEKVGKRFESWLKSNINDFSGCDNTSLSLARRFYNEFRNGLIHEGRIQNGGQFLYDCPQLINMEQSVMMVNPRILLDTINKSHNKYINKLKNDEFTFQAFRCTMIQDFRKDVEICKQVT